MNPAVRGGKIGGGETGGRRGRLKGCCKIGFPDKELG